MKSISISSRQVLLIFCAIVTITLTNLPNFHPERYLHWRYSVLNDMIFHGCYYFFVSLFLLFVLRINIFSFWFKVFALLTPALLEFSQAFVPGRTSSVSDLVANYLGIAVALFIWSIVGTYVGVTRRNR